MRWFIALVFVGITTSAGAEDAPAKTGNDQLATRAQARLRPFKKALKGALVGAMKSGGPMAAVSACNAQAPALTKAAAKDGVVVGRTGSRLRNPANTTPDWLKTALEANPQGRKVGGHVLAELPNGRIGYAEPIHAKPVCLKCHGENIAPKLAARLAALYPKDAATNYRLGDFRGMFWLTMPR